MRNCLSFFQDELDKENPGQADELISSILATMAEEAAMGSNSSVTGPDDLEPANEEGDVSEPMAGDDEAKRT